MNAKVVVVTGSNCGIGKQTAANLASLGATVVLACRNTAKADEAATDIKRRTGSDEVHTVRVDLEDLGSAARCAEEVLDRFGIVDVLVNNAGGFWDVRATTVQGFERHFGVNYLSHYVLTRKLLDALGGTSPRRIVSVTSVGHRAVRGINWADLQFERGWSVSRAYGQSKLAQILLSRELARRFGNSGVIAHAAHPGVVRSNFAEDGDTRGLQRMLVRAISVFGTSPEGGARTPTFLASSEEATRSNGGYWVRNRQRRPSRAACDDTSAVRLWELSEDLARSAGVTF